MTKINLSDLALDTEHDLKNPLASIQALAILLKGLNKKSKLENRYLLKIEKNIFQISNLLSLFFEFIYLKENRIKLKLEFINFNELLKGVLRKFKRKNFIINNESIKTQDLLADKELFTKAFEYLLEVALFNLNTKKKIILDYKISGNSRKISIIFNSTDRKIDFNNLKIYVAKEIVKMHRGKITLNNNEISVLLKLPNQK